MLHSDRSQPLTELSARATSEALLHSILATVPDAMIVIDEAGVIV